MKKSNKLAKRLTIERKDHVGKNKAVEIGKDKHEKSATKRKDFKYSKTVNNWGLFRQPGHAFSTITSRRVLLQKKSFFQFVDFYLPNMPFRSDYVHGF